MGKKKRKMISLEEEVHMQDISGLLKSSLCKQADIADSIEANSKMDYLMKFGYEMARKRIQKAGIDSFTQYREQGIDSDTKKLLNPKNNEFCAYSDRVLLTLTRTGASKIYDDILFYDGKKYILEVSPWHLIEKERNVRDNRTSDVNNYIRDMKRKIKHTEKYFGEEIRVIHMLPFQDNNKNRVRENLRKNYNPIFVDLLYSGKKIMNDFGY